MVLDSDFRRCHRKYTATASSNTLYVTECHELQHVSIAYLGNLTQTSTTDIPVSAVSGRISKPWRISASSDAFCRLQVVFFSDQDTGS